MRNVVICNSQLYVFLLMSVDTGVINPYLDVFLLFCFSFRIIPLMTLDFILFRVSESLIGIYPDFQPKISRLSSLESSIVAVKILEVRRDCPLVDQGCLKNAMGGYIMASRAHHIL